MSNVFVQWLKRLRPEDPRRMHCFREQLQNLNWERSNVAESLGKLFNAVDDLTEAEVRYYYRRRGTRALLSGLFRTLAWVFGTIGIILPLFAATNQYAFKSWGPWGYVFLAGGASFLGANALFGGTTGHVRFVSTQLELEKLITASRIEWCNFSAHIDLENISDEQVAYGFALIQAYAEKLYETTLSETGHWGETLMEELKKYQKSIKNQGKGES